MLFALIQRMRWVGEAARLFAKHIHINFSQEIETSGLDVGRRITIEMYCKKLSLKVWAEFVWFRT